MANITRFTPFDNTFDDLLRGFFVRPMTFDGEPANVPQIRMDVKENEKGYVVHADIPGVSKEDIHVDIDGNQVSITAEVKRRAEQKEGERVLKTERFYGKTARAFALASEVDAAGAQAKYADGVLELVLPKKVAANAKQITIQ
ncbi:MAG: Hsp20/alpha crystallin family protein [Burkholderiales bacterium]|nr:Hsp20/alpha crystallin family protein [Burkholderiales bacterium]